MISFSTCGWRTFSVLPVPGVVHVVARLVADQAVVGGVVDAAEAQRRAQLIAFGGVVVDHVENHLDAGAVQRLHHGLELADLLAAIARRANSAHPARRS